MDKMFWKITKFRNRGMAPITRREYMTLPDLLRNMAGHLETGELIVSASTDKIVIERTSEAEYRNHVHPRFKGM
jgi:hypothetical protein